MMLWYKTARNPGVMCVFSAKGPRIAAYAIYFCNITQQEVYMRKKQLFALLGALVLGLSTAACGSSGSGTQAPAENSAVEEDSASAGETTSAEDTASAEETTSAEDTASAGETASADAAAAEDDGFVPEDSQLSEDGSVIEFPEAGVAFTLPESFKDTKGFLPSGGGEISAGDGVYCMYYDYVALTEDDYNNLLVAYKGDSDNAAKYEDFFNPRVLGLFSVYAADKNRSAEEIGDYLKKLYEENGTPLSDENPLEGAELIGTAGEYNFYFLDATKPDTEIDENNADFKDTYDLSGFNEEYAALVEDVKNNCADLMKFSEPTSTGVSAEPGAGVSFESVDLDGNPVSSKDLFSQNKITMVNLWGSFCSPCIAEMPELEKLYAEFQKEGCGIVGVLADVQSMDDTDIIEDGKQIVADTGVTYPNVVAWDTLQDQLPFNAYPTTYFVDSQGKVIGSPIVGADVDSYSTRLHEALQEIGE